MPESGSPEVPRRWRRALYVACGALIAGLVCSACSGSPGSASSSVTITLYNGQHPQTTDSLVAAFERATGIHVAVRDNDEDTFDDEIVAEGARSPADVIYTENSPALQFLQQRGLLASVSAATLAKTPARFDSSAGDWVGVSARVSVLVYNPKLISVSALPTTVLALGDPRYAGKLAIAPSETDFQPIVTSVLRAVGTSRALAWLRDVKTNGAAHVYPDNETIVSEVNRGAAALGVVNQYYWYRLRSEIGAADMHSRLAYFAPGDPGYVLDVSGAAILKSSHHQALAQRFLAFLVSRQGQEIIAHSTSYEYPVASGVKTAQAETGFADLRPNPIDLAELGTGSTAIALLREVELL